MGYLFTGKTPDYLLKKREFSPLVQSFNPCYFNNMSQDSAILNKNLQTTSSKLPTAILSTDLGNRHTQTKCAPTRGVNRKMRYGERTNKIPTYEKRLQSEGNRQQATGNRQQATGNRQQATGNRQQATGNRQQALYTSSK